jgi:Cu/Ag efflux protein CusF
MVPYSHAPMKKLIVSLAGLVALVPGVRAQQKPKPTPTPSPKQATRARLRKARAVPAKPPRSPAALVVPARPPAPKPTPAPALAAVSRFSGVITAIDLEKNTVTVKQGDIERVFSFLPTVALNFHSGEDKGLASLTKGTQIEITLAEGSRARVIVVHDLIHE